MTHRFVVTGPPGAGKTTVSRALMQRFERGVHIDVDEIRERVVSGMAHPIDWTEETTLQFELAEDAAVDVARRYADAGLAVAIDHCTMPARLDRWLHRSLATIEPTKIVVICSLDENLMRNRTRIVRDFDTSVLEPYIPALSEAFLSNDWSGWHVFDSTGETVDQTVAKIIKLAGAL